MFYPQDDSLFSASEFPFDNFQSTQWKMTSVIKENEEGTQLSYIFTNEEKSVEAKRGDWVVLSNNEELKVYPDYMFQKLFKDSSDSNQQAL